MRIGGNSRSGSGWPDPYLRIDHTLSQNRTVLEQKPPWRNNPLRIFEFLVSKIAVSVK